MRFVNRKCYSSTKGRRGRRESSTELAQGHVQLLMQEGYSPSLSRGSRKVWELRVDFGAP